MPVEARYIVFSSEEINALLHRYAHARGIAIPDGRLTHIAAAKQGYVLTFVDDFDRRQPFEVPATALMAAILLDCRYQRVPVAREFAKRLEPMGATLALVASNGCTAVPTTCALSEVACDAAVG